MRLDIRIQKVDLPTAVTGYVERRLRFSLTRRESQIRRISVRIFDVNGPRGGVDKCCRITAHLHPQETVVVEEINADLFAAIDRAAERVARTFTRKLKRKRDLRTSRESVRINEPSPRRPPADQTLTGLGVAGTTRI